MIKSVLFSLALVASFSNSASAVNMICTPQAIKTAAVFAKDSGCRSQVAVLYGIHKGRCLTESSFTVLKGVKPNTKYQVCLREHTGMVAGNYVASIESIGQSLDSGIVYE